MDSSAEQSMPPAPNPVSSLPRNALLILVLLFVLIALGTASYFLAARSKAPVSLTSLFSPKWNTFTNTDYGYSIKYPQDLPVYGDQASPDSVEFGPYISINVYDQYSLCEQPCDGEKITSTKKITINGYQAKKITGIYTETNEAGYYEPAYSFLRYEFTKKQLTYQFEVNELDRDAFDRYFLKKNYPAGRTPGAISPENVRILEKMLATLKFSSPKLQSLSVGSGDMSGFGLTPVPNHKYLFPSPTGPISDASVWQTLKSPFVSGIGYTLSVPLSWREAKQDVSDKGSSPPEFTDLVNADSCGSNTDDLIIAHTLNASPLRQMAQDKTNFLQVGDTTKNVTGADGTTLTIYMQKATNNPSKSPKTIYFTEIPSKLGYFTLNYYVSCTKDAETTFSAIVSSFQIVPEPSPTPLTAEEQGTQNSKRFSDVVALLNALYQYQADNLQLPNNITSSFQEISKTSVDLCSPLVTTYLDQLPVDPAVSGIGIRGCTGYYDTGYQVKSVTTVTGTKITVSAPKALPGEEISITRSSP